MEAKMRTGVMAFKIKADKDSIKAMAYQVSQITTKCVPANIKLIDCVVVFGGTKDILRELRKIKKIKQFDCVLIYSAKYIAQSVEEYNSFEITLQDELSVEVLKFRTD